MHFTAFDASSRQRCLSWGKLALLPLYFLLLSGLMPEGSGRVFDTDEGIHLMLARVYQQGHAFFSAIRYDHFPLFDVWLAHWMSVFGGGLASARLMVSLMSALLLALFYRLVEQRSGWLAACAGCALLLLSSSYLLLSAALMKTLPLLALVLLSLWCLRRCWPRVPGWGAVVASALCMALAILLKLFAVLMLPALLFALWQQAPPRPARYLLIWLLAVVVFIVAAVVWIAPDLLRPSLWQQNLDYVFTNHLHQHSLVPRFTLWHLLGKHPEDAAVLLLGGAFMVVLVRHAGWRWHQVDAFPLLCLLLTGAALSLMHPIWYHYYPLLLVPLVWLASSGLGYAVHVVRQQGDAYRRIWPGWMAVLLMLALGWRVMLLLDQHHTAGQKMNGPLLLAMQSRAEAGCTVVTDRPLYAYLAGCTAPPELAAPSMKMMHAGLQRRQDYLHAIVQYQPDLVLLARFGRLRRMHPKLLAYGYQLSYRQGTRLIYTRVEQP